MSTVTGVVLNGANLERAITFSLRATKANTAGSVNQIDVGLPEFMAVGDNDIVVPKIYVGRTYSHETAFLRVDLVEVDDGKKARFLYSLGTGGSSQPEAFFKFTNTGALKRIAQPNAQDSPNLFYVPITATAQIHTVHEPSCWLPGADDLRFEEIQLRTVDEWNAKTYYRGIHEVLRALIESVTPP